VTTPSSDAQPSDDNAALIGGIVGGVVALLLIGGLIAFIALRSRRNVTQNDSHNAMTTTSATPTLSNVVPTGAAIYDDVSSVRNPTQSTYVS
jgi:hypothetical protein